MKGENYEEENNSFTALAMCMVMVLGLIPAKAQAVELDGKNMPQLDSYYQDSWGEYHFDTFSDLKTLINKANNDPYNYYLAYYEGYSTLNISSSITIPYNMTVLVYGNDMTIPSGVTVTIDGGYFYVEETTTINGTLTVKNEGEFAYTEILYIYGAINLYGGLSARDNDALIYGAERISVGDGAYFNQTEWYATAAEIVQMCNDANAAVDLGNYYCHIYVEDPATISSSLYVPENVTIYVNDNLTIYGDLELKGYLAVYAPVYLGGKVTNHGSIDIWYDDGGKVTFAQPAAYSDRFGINDFSGIIWVNSYNPTFPADAIQGLSYNSFDYQNYVNDDDYYMPYWDLEYYMGAHQHTPVQSTTVPATCLTYGSAGGSYCATCGEELVKPETLAPLGHMYSDFYDTTCDVCGAVRVVNPTHLTSSMYRMYNPNTGEHFYTGSMEERRTIEAAGWKYEGVGFTICANEGEPVYRLYQPSTGEHLYTMDVNEKNYLAANGWNVEGVAFNSCPNKDVPQYRLWNPNARVGAYHFTASMEERNNLLAAGWVDQGIGFYSCWQ